MSPPSTRSQKSPSSLTLPTKDAMKAAVAKAFSDEAAKNDATEETKCAAMRKATKEQSDKVDAYLEALTKQSMAISNNMQRALEAKRHAEQLDADVEKHAAGLKRAAMEKLERERDEEKRMRLESEEASRKREEELNKATSRPNFLQ